MKLIMKSTVAFLLFLLYSIIQVDASCCQQSQCKPGIRPDHYWALGGCLDGESACSSNIGTSSTSCTKNELIPETEISSTGLMSRALPIIVGPRGNCAVYLDRSYSDSINFGEFTNTCLTRLELCKRGMTVSVWLKINTDINGRMYYLSSGGQTRASRGIAIYGSRNVETYGDTFILSAFATDLHTTWTVETQNILNDRWTHVAFTWSQHHGLRLFIDGQLQGQDKYGTPSINSEYQYTQLMIGRPNSVADYYGTSGFFELKIYYQHLEDHNIAEAFSNEVNV